MNQPVRIIAISVLLSISSAACAQPAVETNTPQPSATLTKTPTMQPTPTLTFTTRPTSTASFTPTPFPTLTPTATPSPDKQILIQYGWFGGDGVGIDWYYLGSNMPEFVLYVDGQLLLQEGNRNFVGGITYSRVELPTDEICGLLNAIDEAGFFELEDDGRNWAIEPVLYTFYGSDEWPPFGEGSTNPIIQVNGEPAQDIAILDDWLDYLIPEVKDVYTLLDTYRHPGLEPYVPDRILLLVIRWPNWMTEEAGLVPQPWPDDLPPLAELDAQADQALARGEMRHVLLEGELAAEVYHVLGSRIVERPFSEDGEVYYLTARLLLPHETVDNISPQPYVNRAEFPLPFDCDE